MIFSRFRHLPLAMFTTIPYSLFSSSFLRFATAATVLAVLAPTGALAADKPAKGAVSKGPADRVLTPAQLKDCVDQKAAASKKVDAAQAAKEKLAADKAEIERSAQALEESLAALDRTSAEAVNAHNARVEQRDASITAYQGRVAAFNEQAESANAAQDAYAKSCAERRYDERDLDDLKRKKK